MRRHLYFVWVFEPSPGGPTLALIVPRTATAAKGLEGDIRKVKQRMYAGCCHAVGELTLNFGDRGWFFPRSSR